MNLLAKMSNRFRIDVKNSPSKKNEIDSLMLFSPIPLPSGYLDLIHAGTELEILIDESKYIRIWGAKQCLDMNNAYEIQKNLGSCLAIADDQGGGVLVVMKGNLEVADGLYLSDLSCLDTEELQYISKSLEEFFVDETGLECL